MIILKHFPALQVLIPFMGGIIAALSFNKKIAWIISTGAIFASLILSIYAINQVILTPFLYNFGEWSAPIGIEYRIDILNQPIIIFFNSVLLFFLIFGSELLECSVLKYIDEPKQYLFYALLLFAHTGYLGVTSTNDLFNIYVFIEISSLATYVLISKGKNSFSLVGAFDYLIMGTIGATMILIGIGFLYALTGSLNITDIAKILNNQGISKISVTAIIFIISGIILKMAFFPMHFWMMRAYSAVAPIILTYTAAISSIFGIYLFMRIIYFVGDNEFIMTNINNILKPIALLTIIISGLFAVRAHNIKDILIYSTCSQIGYMILLITVPDAHSILFQLIIIDALSKIALFIFIAHIDSKTNKLSLVNFAYINNSSLFKTLTAFALIFSSGLPITSMFMVKMKIFILFFEQKMLFEFIIVIMSSLIALLYHLKISKVIFFNNNKNEIIEINSNLSGLTAIIIMQLLSLVFINDLGEYASKTQNYINLNSIKIDRGN